MNDGFVIAIAAAASALMAAAGAFSMGRLASAGALLMFVAALWKYFKRRKQDRIERRHGGDRRNETSVAMSSR